MKSNIEDIELLDAYLKAGLSDEDRQKLESRISAEPSLAEDLQFLKMVTDSIRIADLEKNLNTLKSLESELSKSTDLQLPKKKSNKNWIRILLLISAGVALVVAAYFILADSKAEQNKQYALNDDEFYKYILHKNVRNTEQDTDSQKSMAYNLFTIRDFKNAIPKLENLWTANADTLAYFYLGISKLSKGQIQEAKTIFTSEALKKYPVDDLIKLCE